MRLALLSDIHGNPLALDAVLACQDREAVIKAIEQSGHPTPSLLISFVRGERISSSDPGFFQAGRRAKSQKEK